MWVQGDFPMSPRVVALAAVTPLPCDSTLSNFGPSHCSNSVFNHPFPHPFAGTAHPSPLPAGLQLGRSPQGCSGLQLAALLSPALAWCSPRANTCCASVSIAGPASFCTAYELLLAPLALVSASPCLTETLIHTPMNVPRLN